MSKVVFRISKLKTWSQVATAASHNHRTRPTPNAGDSSRNVFIKHTERVIDAVIATIGTQKIRKNAVLAVEVIISASPEYFRPRDPSKAGTWDQKRLDAWREKMEPWIADNFPHAVSVVLHLDEATPHYQIIDVPLDDRGRLNARAKYGGKETLRRWQDKAAEPVKSLGIERGIAGSLAKHERIKQFYGAVNAPTPELPKVKTPAPPPLPEPTLAERVPFTAAKAARDELDAKHRAQVAQRSREIRAYEAAAARVLPQVAAKANIADMAMRKQKQAEATAERLAKQTAEQRAQADRLRALPLADVLQRVYGAVEAKDSKPSYQSRKFNLPDGRQIAITGEKWIEQGGKGGKGAINLVMHLDGLEFKPAVRLLADYFDGPQLVAERTRELADAAAREVADAAKEPTPTPRPSPTMWPKVRQWLEDVRGIPGKLVDWLHEKGLVFADERGNAVFKREHGGAFVRGTGTQKFHRTIGKADAGAFLVPGDIMQGLYLVEGPVDALAIKATAPAAMVVATGGNLIPPSRLAKLVPPGTKVYAAFDADAAGERLADEAATVMCAERHAPPGHKDWAECVKNEPWRVSTAWLDSDAIPGNENALALKTPRYRP